MTSGEICDLFHYRNLVTAPRGLSSFPPLSGIPLGIDYSRDISTSTVSPSRPREHPIRELLLHEQHPFPKDMEDMIRRLHLKAGAISAEIAMDAYDWERGEQLERGRKKLHALCALHGV